jgi:uncharacterized protein YbbC (DUF1343 family)
MIGSSIQSTTATICAATPFEGGGIALPISSQAITTEKAGLSVTIPYYTGPALKNHFCFTAGRTKAVTILLSLCFIFCLLPTCSLAQPTMGAQQLNLLLPKLKSQRVALLVNHTSTVGKTHIVDTLLQSGVTIQKIFAPEHGFRGNADAGETIKDGIDSKTQLPVISLYGKNKKPTAEQLRDVDVVIFDIQDVGARFYTYIGSMHYLMEGCAEQRKKLIILDRPNPNGSYIDGPVLDMSLRSFVGMHPVPITHGMTVGEYAQMINGQGWLEGKIKCEIEVVKMKNYTHQTSYSLPIKPSPNMPYDQTVALYPSTCLFEGTVLSVGRGTEHPFEWIGHPDLKNQPFEFTPISIEGMSKNPPHENNVCFGINLEKETVKKEISLKYLIDLYTQFPDKEKFFIPFFDKLVGNKTVREQIRKGMTESQIKSTWKKELEQYKRMRKKYLLYN